MPATTIDPYATLGIPPGATRAEAGRAHRKLAKRYHPDVNPGPAAADRMRRINEAWRILSDPTRRATYDADRAMAARPVQPASATWAAWPDARVAPAPRTRRPPRRAEEPATFGDRPAVILVAWLVLGVLYVVGTWLGSLGP